MEKVVVKQSEKSAVVVILTPVTDETADALRETLDNIINKIILDITLDMEGINIIRTPVMGVIVFTHRKLQKLGGRLSLIHMTPALMELFKAFGLDRVLSIS